MQAPPQSTGLPPSIEVAERGALSGLLVSEMLKRSVEEEDCTQWRSNCSDSDTVCDLWISLRGHHFGGHWPGIEPGAAPARSKALNHYPVVVAYFWQVRCAGSSTGVPPSIEVAERGALSGLLVSKMLKRSVEEENWTQWRSGCSDSDTVSDVWISRGGHHFRGLSDVTLTSASAGNRTKTALARSKALNHYPVRYTDGI